MRPPAQAAYRIAADLRARYGDVWRVSIARKINTANFSKLVEFGGSRRRTPRLIPYTKIQRFRGIRRSKQSCGSYRASRWLYSRCPEGQNK